MQKNSLALIQNKFGNNACEEIGNHCENRVKDVLSTECRVYVVIYVTHIKN
jgi:hypothetical protein